MSKYTTEVRYICENAAGLDESKGFSDVDEIIENAIPSIFSFDFPIFDETYRNVICTKILRHYYTREIGFETVGLWKLKLQTKLNEIMPFYNQLYESELIKFNPLYDVDLETRHEGEKFDVENGSQSITSVHSDVSEDSEDYARNKNSNSIGVDSSENRENESGFGNKNVSNTNVENENAEKSGAGSSNTSQQSSDSKSGRKTGTNVENIREKNYDLYSDTPQGALDGVEDEEYLTNARKITNEKNNDQNNVENNYESGSGTSSSQGTSVTNESDKTNKVSIENGNESNSNNVNRTQNKKNERFDNNEENETNSGTKNSKSEGTKAENLNRENNISSTEAYTLHVIGKQAGVSYSKLLKEFRDTFLNIDMEVIKALSPLFFNLW